MKRFLLPFLSCLGVSACQGSGDGLPDPASVPPDPTPAAYTADVLAAKHAAKPAEIEQTIARLQGLHGVRPETPHFGTADAPGKPTESDVDLVRQALVTQPNDLEILYADAAMPAGKGFRKTFRVAQPGNVVVATAHGYTPGADPMLFLIQFDAPSFASNGTLPYNAQNAFRIVAMNDDDGNGGTDSKIVWTAGPQDAGFYMLVAVPFSRHSTGRIAVTYQQVNAGGTCPAGAGCESWSSGPDGEALAGGVVRGGQGPGANRFETKNSPWGMDPWLFVFKTSANTGVANDDNDSRDSVVYDQNLSIGLYDFVLVSTYLGEGTVIYQQSYASECKRITADNARRCVSSRSNGTIDMYLSNRDKTPWEETYTQNSHTDEKNWCGPVAGENLLVWYGKEEPIANLGSDMKTNRWGDVGTVINACFKTCPSVADVPGLGWVPGGDYLQLSPACTAWCSAWASVVFEIITEAGTLPDDLKNALNKRRSSEYKTVTGSKISLDELKASLNWGDPVIALISKGENKLHWVAVTGLFLDSAGVLRLRIANYDDSPTFAEFQDLTSLNRVGTWKGIMENVGVKPFYYRWERTLSLTSQF